MGNSINENTGKPWFSIQTAPDGVEIWTKVDDHLGERMIQKMKKKGNLWFAGSMYVYYSPTHWSY